MKKNKLIAILIIVFVLAIPMNFGFLNIDETQGTLSLIMMVIIEFAVLAALMIGVDKR